MTTPAVTHEEETLNPPSWVVLAALLIPPFMFPHPGEEIPNRVAVVVILAVLVVGYAGSQARENLACKGLMVGSLICVLVSGLSMPNLVPQQYHLGLQLGYVIGVLIIGGGFMQWTQQFSSQGSSGGREQEIEALRVQLAAQAAASSENSDSPIRLELEETKGDIEYLERLQYNLLRTASEQIVLMSGNLQVKLVNQRFRDYFKLVPDEELDRDFTELVSNKELTKALRDSIGKGGVREVEFNHYVKKAGEKRLSARICGEQDGMILLAMDEMKTAADVASRLPKTQIINMQSEKLQLAGGVLDEMMESLEPVIGQLMGESENLLGRSDLSDDVHHAAGSLRGLAQNLGRILKTFSSFADKHLEKTEEVNIVAILEEALEPKNYAFDLAEFSIKKDIPMKRPKVDGSKSQLKQAFTNLLRNAFEAIQRAGRDSGELEIRVADDAGMVVIDIADNGTGVSAGNLRMAMKGTYSAKHEGDGGGMGLSVAQRTIFSHRGNLLAASEEGEGTVFTIQLPTA